MWQSVASLPSLFALFAQIRHGRSMQHMKRIAVNVLSREVLINTTETMAVHIHAPNGSDFIPSVKLLRSPYAWRGMPSLLSSRSMLFASGIITLNFRNSF